MKVIWVIITLVFLYSCATEPRGIVYEFKIINDTDSDYVVEKHFKDSKGVFSADTLVAGSEMVLVVPRVGSYGESFGESLIPSFFDTLLVNTLSSKRFINVSKRSYWKETAELGDDFLEKPGSMKGKVIYTLKLRNAVK
jgi:hypothetical protein